MPYKSEAQQRFMHAVHPGIAARWDKETNFKKKLPKKLKKKVTEGYVTGIANPFVLFSLLEVSPAKAGKVVGGSVAASVAMGAAEVHAENKLHKKGEKK